MLVWRKLSKKPDFPRTRVANGVSPRACVSDFVLATDLVKVLVQDSYRLLSCVYCGLSM